MATGAVTNGKFKVVKFLGKGSYGSVYQVQRISDGQTYALKEMDVKAMSQVEREDAVNEIRLLASVQNPNVIRYHEAFLDGNKLCIIMEYAPGGDLSKVIKKFQSSKKPMPEEYVWRYFIQIARGLQALHSLKILHRDIKPGNLMVTDRDIVKIGDLGISKVLKHTMAKTQIGTPHYMPPEIWKNKPYSFTSDTWALGCALYEMATYNVPFEARSMQELRYKVMRGGYPPVAGAYSRELQDMVKACLESNPDRRPTVDMVLAMPSVQQRLNCLPREVLGQPPSTAASSMLDTIKVPKDLNMLKNRLPPAQYQGGFGAITEEDEEPAGKLPALPQPNRYPQQQAPPPGYGAPAPQYGQYQQAPNARPISGMPARPPAPQKPGAPAPSQQYGAPQQYGRPAAGPSRPPSGQSRAAAPPAYGQRPPSGQPANKAAYGARPPSGNLSRAPPPAPAPRAGMPPRANAAASAAQLQQQRAPGGMPANKPGAAAGSRPGSRRNSNAGNYGMPQQKVGGPAAAGGYPPAGGLQRMQSTSHASYGAFYQQQQPGAKPAAAAAGGQYGGRQYGGRY